MTTAGSAGERVVTAMLRETTLARGLSGPSPASRAVVVALVAVGLVEWWAVARLAAGTPALGTAHVLALGANYPPAVAQGQLWRLLSAAWIHADAAHLLLNVVAVGMLGGLVERLYGSHRFVVIWVATCVGGNLAHIVSVELAAVGASAGLAGLAGVLGVFALRNRTWLPRRLVNALLSQSAMVLVAISLIGLGSGRIDHAAHLGGLLAGALVGMILRSGADPGPARGFWLRIASGVALGAVLWSGVMLAVEWRRCGRDAVDWTVCYGSWVGLDPVSESSSLDAIPESD